MDMNKKANATLKKLFISKGIITCEICHSPYQLTWMHRKKRRYYLTAEELSDFSEVILACMSCHQKCEYDREATENLFSKLRGTVLE
jgi:hypothetical protein